MADEPDLDNLPQATVVRKKRLRISIIWIIPMLAAVVAIGIAIQRVRSEGPTITIAFKSAEGIEAGKTFIKYKDVRIGLVTAVELSEDYTKVLVKAKIAKHAAGLMVADAKFWVVEPRISLSGVSGLSTLLSGNYIGFQAGKSGEEPAHVHRARRAADHHGPAGPAVRAEGRDAGFARRRHADLLPAPHCRPGGGLQPRRRRQVGRDHGLRQRALRQVRHHRDALLERERRRRLASARTASTCAPSRSPRCSRAESPSTRPTSCRRARRPPRTRAFTLYRNRAIAMKQPDPVERRFVLYFNESVRGLSVGAPVTLFGLQVGEVTEVGPALRSGDARLPSARARSRSSPTSSIGRTDARGSRSTHGKSADRIDTEARLRMLRRIVEERGLRAQLQHRQLPHRRAVRRVRVLPECAEGEDRLGAGSAGAAGGPGRPRQHRGEARAASSPRSTTCRSTRSASRSRTRSRRSTRR